MSGQHCTWTAGNWVALQRSGLFTCLQTLPLLCLLSSHSPPSTCAHCDLLKLVAAPAPVCGRRTSTSKQIRSSSSVAFIGGVALEYLLEVDPRNEALIFQWSALPNICPFSFGSSMKAELNIHRTHIPLHDTLVSSTRSFSACGEIRIKKNKQLLLWSLIEACIWYQTL